MKVLITGSRSIKLKEYIFYILDKNICEGDFIIQGGAVGVDLIVLDWCNQTNLNINFVTIKPVKVEKREYYLHRNAEMVGMCDKVIAIWDGKSGGTKFTIDYAKARKKPVLIFNPNDNQEALK